MDSPHPWLYYNGSAWVQSRDLLAACTTSSQHCCRSVQLSSSRSSEKNSSLYSRDTLDSLGLYTAVGLYNGRHLYQRPGLDR